MVEIAGLGNLGRLVPELEDELAELGITVGTFDTLDRLVAHLGTAGDGVVAVLVGPGTKDALEVARAVGRSDATLEVILLQDSGRAADQVLARAIAPFLGPQVRTLTVDQRSRVLAELQAGTHRTVARRVGSNLPDGGPHRTLEQQILFRRSAEAHFRLSQQFLDSIIENVPDMLFVKEAEELRFVRFNLAGEELLGFARTDMYGKNDYDFFPQDEADFFTAKDREVLAGHKMVEVPEEPIQTRDRGLRWLRTRKLPLFDEQGQARYLVGISQDITEEKLAREGLARAVDDLARSNKDLEDFAYIASHDLQEPLRKVRAFGDLLATRARPKLDDEELRLFERMTSAVERMQRLIDDLLAYSRITRNAGPPQAVELDLVVADVLDDLRPRLDADGGTVEVEALPRVLGHPTQMQQLFQNLIGNALKFRRPGVPPEVRVRPVAETDGLVGIAVEDDGIGFDEKYLDRIFAPFQRLHTRDQYPGTGIGLAVCQRIVERGGGRLSATSQPGAGARFLVEMPAASEDS